MRRFPEPIQNAVAAFTRLPGVGPKTALRYVYYLLRRQNSELASMAHTIQQLGEKISICEVCYAYTESARCDICSDARRNSSLLCVVEESRDIATIESTDTYKGYYHVLGGTLRPIEGMTPDQLRIRQLMDRLQKQPTEEVILAFSPTVHGETTMLYLAKQLQSLNIPTTKLARGLPIGATLEHADEITLGDAMRGRK